MSQRVVVLVFAASLLAIVALAGFGASIVAHDRDVADQVAAEDRATGALAFDDPAAPGEGATGEAGADGAPQGAVSPTAVTLSLPDEVLAGRGTTLQVGLAYDAPARLGPACYTIDWGDGTVDDIPCIPGSCTVEIFSEDPLTVFPVVHEYAEPGTYELTASVAVDETCGRLESATTVTVVAP